MKKIQISLLNVIAGISFSLCLLSFNIQFANAGTVTGSPALCITSSYNTTYTASGFPGATGYSWSLPSGVTISSGANTYKITATFSPSATSGVVMVTAFNNSGFVGMGALYVLVDKPLAAAGPITGPPQVCTGQTMVPYSIPSIYNASEYQWIMPPGATKASQNGRTVNINFSSSFNGGTLRVFGVSSGPCGGGPSSTLVIAKASPLGSAGTITGNSQVCQMTNGHNYSIPPIANATGYEWSVPTGANIISGQNTNSIQVNYSSSASNGIVSVFGKNCLGNGALKSKSITVTQGPGQAGVIEGPTIICPGQTGVPYEVPPIANATGYVWSVPGNTIIKTGQNTNRITVDFQYGSGGDISVYGTGCGLNGQSSSLAISSNQVVGGTNASHSVDLITGTLNVALPIFKIVDGDAEINGVLNYNATGVRVTDDDGWVGHNWNLSVQSYKITREMRGLPDDLSATGDSRRGWLYGTKRTAVKNFNITTDNNNATCSDEVANYNFLNGIGYKEDTEPDVFYVNAPGLSFEFYFDENRQPQALPYQDIIITPNVSGGAFAPSTTAGVITSFNVLDSRGFEYIFASAESITEDLLEANEQEFYFVRKSKLHMAAFTYNTSWRLTRVISPVYGQVDFTYKTVNSEDSNLYPDRYKKTNEYKYRFANEVTNEYSAGGLFSYSRTSTLKILEKITTPTTEVIFNSDRKSAVNTMERLGSIDIYDKREGTSRIINKISLFYHGAERSFLATVNHSADCYSMAYKFEYYPRGLPAYNSKEKDDWAFYKSGSKPYDETVTEGSLMKIIHPYKGYDVFFYEPHDFYDGAETIQGGGMRIRKSISYDGISPANDIIKEYEYKADDGKSSGKLQYKAIHNFSVARTDYLSTGPNSFNKYNEPRYREMQKPEFNTYDLERMFTLESEEELSHYSMLQGSVVGYQRVKLKQSGNGHSIFEFDLPASYGDISANDNEWQASKVHIARPAAGPYGCYETAIVKQGINQYPFPPNPKYDFAKGILRKVTDFRENGDKVREELYEYQRVYGNGSSIRKIYGLALEELPTYYYNTATNSYVDSKMFVYSKYELFTDVKTELSLKKEIIYNSSDLSQKTENTENFYFESPEHRQVTRIVRQNSDGSQLVNKLKYVKDFVITTANDVNTQALKDLNTGHRQAIIESTTSKIRSGTETYLGATLSTFKTVSGKVYPDKQYEFISNEGSTSFTPSSVTGGTTFNYDRTNYALVKSHLSFDNYGNLTEIQGRDRSVNSVGFGYSGTLPVINISGARLGEVRYSDFETISPVQFTINSGSASYGLGRNDSKGLNLPPGNASSNFLSGSFIYDNTPVYVFSFWIKAGSAGNLAVQLSSASTATYTYSYTASQEWKYYSFKVPVGNQVGNGTTFSVKIWGNASTQIDDISFYPEHVDFVTFTYKRPNGKLSETDSRGSSLYYDHDPWGRLQVVYDKDKNVIKKYEYQTRP